MKQPDFNVGDEVVVINRESRFYGKHGKVVRIVAIDSNGYEAEQPSEISSWMADICIDGEPYSFFNWPEQLKLAA